MSVWRRFSGFIGYQPQGNSGSNGGNTASTGNSKALSSNTPFNSREVQILVRRYAAYDSSPGGEEGISLADCLTMTEFTGNKFAASVIEAHLSEETQRIHPKAFLSVLSLLSSKTPAEVKKNYLFQLVDVYDTGLLTHDEMFRVYKLLFSGAVTDDHILDLTNRALQHPDLNRPGEITQDEFFRLMPDNEIMSRLTVDFLSGKT